MPPVEVLRVEGMEGVLTFLIRGQNARRYGRIPEEKSCRNQGIDYSPHMIGLKFLSATHCTYLDSLFDRIKTFYQANLVSLAVYGSYARGENRPDSDIDLLIVLQKMEGERLARQEAFVREIEIPLDPLWSACAKEGFHMEISTLILDRRQAGSFMPLYLDMAEHCVILFDRDQFFQRRLDQVRQQMKRWGSRKQKVGGHWYWEIRPGTKWNEVIDYDK